jgi:hypothetical protein
MLPAAQVFGLGDVPVDIGYGAATPVPVARMSEPLYGVKIPDGTPLGLKIPVGSSALAVKIPEGRSRAGRRATAGVVWTYGCVRRRWHSPIAGA